MRKILFSLLALFMLSCSSAPKSSGTSATCGKTALQESDLEVFGFTPAPGKIVAMRIFATWCPFCKTDLNRISSLFKSGKWSPQTVNLFLLAYVNHGENKETFAAFLKSGLATMGIPREALQIKFVDKPYAELAKSKGRSGDLLFEGWKGVPFALVFGKDGRLATRGHFTMSDQSEDDHYKFISQLQKENCVPPAP